jgi:hypothetical protein
MNEKEKLLTHITKHVDYPTTKKVLVETCNNMEDVNIEDKKWFIENLPEGEYKTPIDVIRVLKI